MWVFLVLSGFVFISTTGTPIETQKEDEDQKNSIYEINKRLEEKKRALHSDVICPDMTLCPHTCPKILGHAVDDNGCEICDECNEGSSPIESDIIVDENNVNEVLRAYGEDTAEGLKFPIVPKGAATSDFDWPKEGDFVTIGYTFEDVSDGKRTNIENAITQFTSHTCIRFVPRTDQTHYINFVGSDSVGCSSYIGLINRGGQSVNLGGSCDTRQGIILHELMHALGFWHEQSRGDRDRYVDIHLENVETDRVGNFEKRSSLYWNSLGSPYDFASVMHYGGTYFSANDLPTITEKGSSEPVLVQRDGFSFEDLWQINTKYQCTDYIIDVPPPTQAPNIPQNECVDRLDVCPQVERQGLCQFEGSFYERFCTMSCTNCEESCEKTLEMKQIEIVSLNERISSLMSNVAELEEENSNLKNSISELTAENSNQAGQIAQLNTQITEITNRNSEQLAEIEQLTSQNTQLESQLTECQKGPQVKDGWYAASNGMQYIVLDISLNWDKSKALCEGIGGNIATEGMRSLDLRREILGEFNFRTIWIGLTDPDGDLSFDWIDGAAGSDGNIHWNLGRNQPNGRGQERCAQVHTRRNFLTEDINCKKSRRTVCEARLGTP